MSSYQQRRKLKRKGGWDMGLYDKRSKYSRSSKSYRRQRLAKLPMRFPSYYGDQPNRKFARLKYVDHYLSPGVDAAAITTKEYRANGMFDPDASIGGHQPYGFDQLMAQYYHFTVVRSTCELEIISNVVNSNQTWMLMLYNDTGTAAAAFADGGANELAELPVISKTILATNTNVGTANTRSTRLHADMAKISGKGPWSLIGDKDYSGDAAADPADQSFFALVGYVGSGSTDAADMIFKITIYYDAVFTEPKFFEGS